MVAPDTDRLRWYRTQANIDAADAYIAALVAEAPPLTAGQKARLRVLMRRAGAPEATLAPTPSTPAAA